MSTLDGRHDLEKAAAHYGVVDEAAEIGPLDASDIKELDDAREEAAKSAAPKSAAPTSAGPKSAAPTSAVPIPIGSNPNHHHRPIWPLGGCGCGAYTGGI
jgi:hypothetical protein